MNKDSATNPKHRKTFFKATSALVGVAAAVFPLSAVAQQQNPPPAAGAEEDEADEGEAVVVTGTRIRSEFNSASPVQVLTTEAATLSGVDDTASLIQGSTLAAGSPQNDATISSAFVTEGGPGSQTVSLRGLGANRTLVLLNGRRAGPAGTRGAVSAFDLNVIPLALTSNVQILKDGASSIYGSDAVAGVVNIITRRDVDGIELNLSYTAPEADGGDNVVGNAVWGTTFDRGYFNIALDYSRQYETTNGQRGITNCSVDYTTATATGLRNDVIDPRTGAPACRGNTAIGLVWFYDYSGEGQLNGREFIQYDGSGSLPSYNPATAFPTPLGPFGPTVPTNWFRVNFDLPSSGLVDTNGPMEQNASFIPSIERRTLFMEGAYELAPNVEAYAEVLVNRRQSETNGVRQVWTYLYSYDFGDPFSVGWNGFSLLSPTGTTDHFSASQDVLYTRAIAGLRGSFAGWLGDVDWDVYVQHSVSDADYTQDVILADAVYSADGRSDFGTVGLFNANSIPRPTASCVGYNTPISNRPCVDVDWLSATFMSGGGFSAAEEAFLFDTETGNTEYTQSFIEASITTDLFTLPAGNVAGAFGLVYREDEINDTPGAVTRAGNSWGLSSAGITAGDDSTSEAFAEVHIPLLSGAPGAQSLDVTLSGRYTDVNSYGDNTTYKAGVNWQITPEFRLRGTHGTSFRAPALFELYLAGQTSFARQTTIDPCYDWANQLALNNIPQQVADNCAYSGGPNPVGGIPGNYNASGASATIVASGGAGLLEAETSTASVFGFVWTPRFMNFNLAVDYFEIEVEDEVATLGAGAILYRCYNSPTFPADPICSLFNRVNDGTPAQYLIDTVNNSYLNVNSQVNRGIDLTASYTHQFPWARMNVQSQVTYQLEDTVELFSGTERDYNGLNGDPEWVANFDVRFDRGDWTYFWGIDLVGPSDDSPVASQTSGSGLTTYDIDAELTAYHSFSVRYRADSWALLLGVANAFDEPPPAVSTVGGASQTVIGPSLFASNYDYLGRRAFVRLTKTF